MEPPISMPIWGVPFPPTEAIDQVIRLHVITAEQGFDDASDFIDNGGFDDLLGIAFDHWPAPAATSALDPFGRCWADRVAELGPPGHAGVAWQSPRRVAISCLAEMANYPGYADRIYTTKRASFLAALKDAIDRCRWGQATATVLCPPGPDHDQMPQMAERLVNIAALLLRLRDPALTGDMLEFMLPVVDAMPAADRVLRPKEQAWIAAKEAAWAAEDPHTRKRKHRIDLALWINKQLAKARAASQDAETAAAHKAAVFKDCTALAALVGFGCDTTVNYMRKLPRPFWELDGMLCSVALMLQNAAQCAPESAMIGGSARGGGAPQLVRRLLEETDISAKWMAYFHAAPMNGRGVLGGNSFSMVQTAFSFWAPKIASPARAETETTPLT